jgi:hypothetical protein
MREGNANAYILAIAALAVAIYLQLQATDLKTSLASCEASYQGFKDGVIYGK